ncbi:hypothetical protein MRX96_004070 [Rhipicephalus microplus]
MSASAQAKKSEYTRSIFNAGSCDQQTRVIRLKEDAERSAKKLQQEISNIKQARVQLMERMKEESERHRRQQTERNREVRALQMRQQQQSAQMARMERQNAMRINVLPATYGGSAGG